MLEHLIGKSWEEKRLAQYQAYKNVGSTEQGMLMLVSILEKLGYFEPMVGDGALACVNVAKDIVGECDVSVASQIFLARRNLMAQFKEKENG